MRTWQGDSGPAGRWTIADGPARLQHHRRRPPWFREMKKRGRNRRKLKRLAVVLALLLFVLAVVMPVFSRGPGGPVHALVLEVVGLGQKGATAIVSSLTGLWEDYLALRNVRKENLALKEEIDAYRRTIIGYREAAALNARLQKLLELKEKSPVEEVAARVIGRDTSSWFRTIVVDRGSDDGVRPGMPVITVEGVVGRVMDSAPGISTVILGIDPNSAVAGLIQRCRAQGIVKGDGDGYLFNYVMKTLDVRKGDLIVTSGMSGVFPKGIPIGRVNSVRNTARGMFQEIEVQPTVEFGRLEFVLVLLRENPLLAAPRGRR